MDVPFLQRLLFKFKDLSSLGTPSTVGVGNVISNERLYNLSPDRLNFYMQLLESITNPNPSVVEAVIKRENLTRANRQQVEDKLSEVQRYWYQLQQNKTEDTTDKLLQEINSKLGVNVLTRNIKLKKKTVADAKGGGASQQAGGAPLELPDYVNKEVDTTTIEQYKNDPILSPDNTKINWADRAIFILTTYIIRSIAIFFVEWGLFSGFIRTFSSAFSMYFGMYLAIYVLFMFLVNSREKDMLFRLLFFYSSIDSEDGKGLLRALLHVLCIFILLPIPYIVKEYREFKEPDVLNFTEKSNILAGIDKFSLYTWVLTSIIVITV